MRVPWPLAVLSWGSATLCGSVALVFALLLVAPGDPVDLVGGDAPAARLRADFGYDRGPGERLAGWFTGVARGDLGVSRVVRPGAPVAEVLGGRLGSSIATLAAATALLGGGGLALAAFTRGERARARAAVQVLSSPPPFLAAFLLVTALDAAAWEAMGRGWIERPAWFALPDQPSALRWGIGVVVLAVGSGALSQVHAELEDHWVRTDRLPWIDAARGRGAPATPLILRATLPVLAASVAGRAAVLAGGLVVVEKVLLVPGAGALLFDAAAARDYDLALAGTLLATTWVVAARTLADLTRRWLDPRLR